MQTNEFTAISLFERASTSSILALSNFWHFPPHSLYVGVFPLYGFVDL
jgi:hypothetical protein